MLHYTTAIISPDLVFLGQYPLSFFNESDGRSLLLRTGRVEPTL